MSNLKIKVVRVLVYLISIPVLFFTILSVVEFYMLVSGSVSPGSLTFMGPAATHIQSAIMVFTGIILLAFLLLVDRRLNRNSYVSFS